MIEMPLFPLNTVLFPGMPLQLHIFESRYKEMVNYCRQNNTPFGVALIRRGQEAHGPLASAYSIGCSAHINQLEPLEGGRFNLLAIGQERFLIHALHYDRPYLVGEVEPKPLESGDPIMLTQAKNHLRPWVERYLHILGKEPEVEKAIQVLPDDPGLFGYLSAVLLQAPPTQKQAFLEKDTCLDLLQSLIPAYRKELALSQAIEASDPSERGRSFTDN